MLRFFDITLKPVKTRRNQRKPWKMVQFYFKVLLYHISTTVVSFAFDDQDEQKKYKLKNCASFLS